ncbi:hypothetical protein BHE74_00014738, partial [Ensete ventricosum]
DFVKKYDSRKLCVKSRTKVEFQSIFRAPSQNLKILTIPNVLAHGKSYEHDFTKKCDGHKLCAKLRIKLSFNRFFMHRLGISKYWQFPTYYPMHEILKY